jgi:hypothetical protein
MELIAILIASYANVFLLVLNSQFARDRRYLLAYINSWFISGAAFAYTRIAANSGDIVYTFLFSGFGSSFGVVSSILFYKWLAPRLRGNV